MMFDNDHALVRNANSGDLGNELGIAAEPQYAYKLNTNSPYNPRIFDPPPIPT